MNSISVHVVSSILSFFLSTLLFLDLIFSFLLPPFSCILWSTLSMTPVTRAIRFVIDRFHSFSGYVIRSFRFLYCVFLLLLFLFLLCSYLSVDSHSSPLSSRSRWLPNRRQRRIIQQVQLLFFLSFICSVSLFSSFHSLATLHLQSNQRSPSTQPARLNKTSSERTAEFISSFPDIFWSVFPTFFLLFSFHSLWSSSLSLCLRRSLDSSASRLNYLSPVRISFRADRHTEWTTLTQKVE